MERQSPLLQNLPMSLPSSPSILSMHLSFRNCQTGRGRKLLSFSPQSFIYSTGLGDELGRKSLALLTQPCPEALGRKAKEQKETLGGAVRSDSVPAPPKPSSLSYGDHVYSIFYDSTLLEIFYALKKRLSIKSPDKYFKLSLCQDLSYGRTKNTREQREGEPLITTAVCVCV